MSLASRLFPRTTDVFRRKATVEALLATLIRPAGAQTGTPNPHIVDCRAVISSATSWLPAPTVSPLTERYREQMESIAATLNRLAPDSVTHRSFDSLAEGVAMLEGIASRI